MVASGAGSRALGAGGHESTVVVVGNRGAGKTTLVSRFLNPEKDDVPKPSVALEYTFGRRSGAHGDVKDVAHIWELGGGVQVRLPPPLA